MRNLLLEFDRWDIERDFGLAELPFGQVRAADQEVLNLDVVNQVQDH
jgi:hypothetical protein